MVTLVLYLSVIMHLFLRINSLDNRTVLRYSAVAHCKFCRGRSDIATANRRCLQLLTQPQSQYNSFYLNRRLCIRFSTNTLRKGFYGRVLNIFNDEACLGKAFLCLADHPLEVVHKKDRLYQKSEMNGRASYIDVNLCC